MLFRSNSRTYLNLTTLSKSCESSVHPPVLNRYSVRDDPFPNLQVSSYLHPEFSGCLCAQLDGFCHSDLRLYIVSRNLGECELPGCPSKMAVCIQDRQYLIRLRRPVGSLDCHWHAIAWFRFKHELLKGAVAER